MAHVITSGTLPISTGSTGIQQALSGRADRIYIRVDDATYMKFADTTGSSGITTAMGLILSTSEINTFVVGHPAPKYIYWVSTSTGDGVFSIIETF